MKPQNKIKAFNCLSMKSLALLLCLSKTVVSTTTEDDSWNGNTVHVMNGLKPGSRIFSAHCKSGDDDLGFRQLSPGEEFNWSFIVNFWGTTLFYCNFWWNFMHTSGEVYGPSEDYPPDIYYRASGDGIYRSYDTQTWDLHFPWCNTH